MECVNSPLPPGENLIIKHEYDIIATRNEIRNFAIVVTNLSFRTTECTTLRLKNDF